MHALPPPPTVSQPASYEVSYGLVTGTAAPGTREVIVRVGDRVLARRPLAQRRFSLRVPLPTGEHTVVVTAVRRDGRRSWSVVPGVYGLPRAATPRMVAPRLDARLQRGLRRPTSRFAGHSAVHVESLTSGLGGAWNARATFPAASTLKLAIAATALARVSGQPGPDSTLGRLLRRMVVDSDDAAANAVETYVGGSVSGGSALVNAFMRSAGMTDSEMYGGYEVSRSTAAAIPWRVDDQPSWGVGKRTTARDLAALWRAVWLASGGRGALLRAQPGFTAADARHLLWLALHVRDRGKLDRELGRAGGVRVAHKAGWISTARHDAGLVFWPGGVFVAAVMTYGRGVGTASDVLAGRVARVALGHLRR